VTTVHPSPFPLIAGQPVDQQLLVEHWTKLFTAPAATSKVMTLPEAIRSTVRAADAVYLGGSLARPNAAAFELVRQFHGNEPGFTVIAPALANQHAVLVHAGLVARVITSLHGNTYPGPGPNPIFTEADQSGTVHFEDWSMLTLVLRLYAAATGVPFLPTRSLVGTDLGRDLADAGLIKFASDPWCEDAAPEIALVSPLHPDVTFVHSLMADPSGNAVMSPPFYEDAWAAFAAHRAVVVTTERVVDSETLRRYAQYVRVPAAAVTAVCEVPFGSHPNQVPGDLVPEVAGYHDDYDFLAELRRVCRNPDELSSWMQRWVLDVSGHDEYLALVGEHRQAQLRAQTRRDAWIDELDDLKARWDDPATRGERNAILGGRYLTSLVRDEQLTTGLAGVGVSTLATWLAAGTLKAAGVSFDLLAEGGMYGYTPLPLDPYLFNYRNLFTSTSLTNVQTVLDVIGGGPNNRTVGVLGAAQVDATGAINTSRINGRMLTGSGGGNDIASTSRAVVVTTVHDPGRLPERVDYITSPGHRVRAIVTDRAVLERVGPDSDFVLTGVLSDGASTKDDLVRDAVSRCGWALPVSTDVALQPPVDGHELAAVRTYDPAGNFVG
jgi:acyl CoA:acetate/3-ketoacid CoA transferase alpha subunit